MSVGEGFIVITFLVVLAWILTNPEKHQPAAHENRGTPGDEA